ncbi:MAG TPA: ASCH domain-containing protein [Ktedonobacterales bacterium]|nr:ASCH domain-containing protein [Ktedonobacterales bacterium]
MDRLRGDAFWERCLEESPRTFHLAIFVPPYLDLILEGRKTAESRFSRLRIAPYGQVAAGDVLLLKRSGGPIAGICLIEHVWQFDLETIGLAPIRAEFAAALCATGDAFWQARTTARYATIMSLTHVRPIAPLPYSKRDRRGWVCLRTVLE